MHDLSITFSLYLEIDVISKETSLIKGTVYIPDFACLWEFSGSQLHSFRKAGMHEVISGSGIH